MLEDAHADRAQPPIAEQREDAREQERGLAEARSPVEDERLVTRGARGDLRDVVLAACEREVIGLLEVVQVAVGPGRRPIDRCQDGHVRDSWTLSATASRNASSVIGSHWTL